MERQQDISVFFPSIRFPTTTEPSTSIAGNPENNRSPVYLLFNNQNRKSNLYRRYFSRKPIKDIVRINKENSSSSRHNSVPLKEKISKAK